MTGLSSLRRTGSLAAAKARRCMSALASYHQMLSTMECEPGRRRRRKPVDRRSTLDAGSGPAALPWPDLRSPLPPGGADIGGYYNLWRGYAVEPDQKTNCYIFLDHTRTNVASANEGHAAFMLDGMHNRYTRK